MMFGFPASYEIDIEVTGSRSDIREAMERTFDLLDWKFTADEERNLFTARVTPNLSWFAQNFVVSFAEEPVVNIRSSCRFQLFDWGQNRRNVNRFLKIFSSRLNWIASLAGPPPTYLDRDERSPIERVIDNPDSHSETC